MPSSKLEVQLTPILSNGVECAVRLYINEADDLLRNIDGFVRTSGMATAGAIWRFNGTDFLLVPNHSLPEEKQLKLELILEEDDEDAEDDGTNEMNEGSDDECEFGGFDQPNSPGDDDVDITSQYSQSPAPSNDGSVSDLENSFKDQSTDSSDEQQDLESLGVGAHAETPTTLDPSMDESLAMEDTRETQNVEEGQRMVLDGLVLMRSSDLDYALIDIDREVGTIQLPVLSEDDLAPIQEGDHPITTITSTSGKVRGVMSGMASHIKLPNSETYEEVYTCKLFASLQRGDCGSIVRDSASGVIYGHIVAGSSVSRIAYVIPAINVLKDIQQQAQEIQWNERQTRAANTHAASAGQRPRYRAIERWFHEDSPWNGRNLRQELLDPSVITGLEAHRYSPSGSSAVTAQTYQSSRASSAPTEHYSETLSGTDTQTHVGLHTAEKKEAFWEGTKIEIRPAGIPGPPARSVSGQGSCPRCRDLCPHVFVHAASGNKTVFVCGGCRCRWYKLSEASDQVKDEATTSPAETSRPDLQKEIQPTEDEQQQHHQELTPKIPNETSPPPSPSENTSRIAHLEQMLADVAKANDTMDDEIAYLTTKIDYLEHIKQADSAADSRARLPALLYQTGEEMDKSDYLDYFDYQQSATPYDAESASAYGKAAGSPFGLERMSQGPHQAF